VSERNQFEISFYMNNLNKTHRKRNSTYSKKFGAKKKISNQNPSV